jgi:hypothetical protein
VGVPEDRCGYQTIVSSCVWTTQDQMVAAAVIVDPVAVVDLVGWRVKLDGLMARVAIVGCGEAGVALGSRVATVSV